MACSIVSALSPLICRTVAGVAFGPRTAATRATRNATGPLR